MAYDRPMDTGISRKIDDLGRIVVPAETRRLFNIREGDELSFHVEGDAIVIRKLDAVCVFCGSGEDVTAHRDRGVCQSCVSELTSRS